MRKRQKEAARGERPSWRESREDWGRQAWAVRGRGGEEEKGLKPLGLWGFLGAGGPGAGSWAVWECRSQGRGCLRKKWVAPGTRSLLRPGFNSLEEEENPLSFQLRIQVEVSLEVMNPFPESWQ